MTNDADNASHQTTTQTMTRTVPITTTTALTMPMTPTIMMPAHGAEHGNDRAGTGVSSDVCVACGH
eukprot:1052568-Rhodomonas_salina.2